MILGNKKETKKFNATFRMTQYLWKLIWKDRLGKIYIAVKYFMSILNAIIPTVYTIFSGLIINELTSSKHLYVLLIYVSIMLTTPVIVFLANYIYSKKMIILQSELLIKLEENYFDNVMDMDYEAYEIPEIQVKKLRANITVLNILNVVDMTSGIIASIFALIAISTIISTLNPIILLITFITLIINYIIARKTDLKVHDFDKQRSKQDMALGIYRNILESSESAKEVRMFQMKDFLIKNYSSQKREMNGIHLKIFKTQSFSSIMGVLMNFIQESALYAVVLFEVLKNSLSIGYMTIYMASARQFSNSISGVMSSYRSLSNAGLKTQDYIDFMNISNKKKLSGHLVPKFDENSVIEFRNVSFRYSGSERYAIKNLNITIRNSNKVCIVGENGSGKSTFIKLLMRLYDPTEGEIFLNGINICEYDFFKYQKLFAAVFQDYVEYPMSIGKNIALCNDFNDDLLNTVCKNSGLSALVSKLPQKYNTPVGKEIFSDGFNPSGGEGQKIAIARACYHGGEIFILDEPTAALDPMAEYGIYKRFNHIITSKCALFITHRLSAVQLADKVAVFDNGKVAEYGTHSELYAKGGIYTEMFDKQAQFYRDEPKSTVEADT